MNDASASMALHLRERATQCREMARIAISPAIAKELQSIAEEYEEDAVRLESTPRRRRPYHHA